MSGVSRVLLLAWLAVGTLAAQEAVDVNALGPQVGARAIPFALSDQNGAARDLTGVAGPNGTMLVFFRSADW